MRLTEIKLAGFKTFVDPTVVPVQGNLVGIVGPNGCGKSNIIDAVRWVLGESRASALRGESLQDVIFNGSAARKPVGRASVELFFDNSAGRASGQWKAYSNIAVRRILQRDGESTYYINNMRVRRRDVRDLFSGMGVSGRGYAIIEQGMISRIIEARPQELRIFLEEAAGISLYRDRRHETELRLTDARSNLLRLNDILSELSKQQRYLEKQAEQASRYQHLHKQRVVLQHSLWTLRKQQAAEIKRSAQAEIGALEQEANALRSILQEAGVALETLHSRSELLNEQQHQLQGQLYAADGEIARTRQSIHHLCENREQLDRQIADAMQQLQYQEQQLNEAKADKVIWQDQLTLAEEQRASCETACVQENERLPAIEAAAQSDQAQLTTLRNQLMLVVQNEKIQQHQRAYAEKMLQQLTARQQYLLSEQSAQTVPDEEQLNILQQEVAELIHLQETKREQLTIQEAQIQDIQSERAHAQETLQTLQHDLIEMSTRLDVLQHLQTSAEDKQDLSAWMISNQLDHLPRLWQQFSVESGWETALEAVLRERIQAITVEYLKQIPVWKKELPPARWSIFALVPEQSSAAGQDENKPDQRGWVPLSTLLSSSHSAVQMLLENWLQGIFIMDSLTSAIENQTLLAADERLVTADGHCVSYCGIDYFAPDSATTGILLRQREVLQIIENKEQVEQSLVSRQRELAEIEQQYQYAVTEAEQLRVTLEEIVAQQHDRQLQAVQLAQQLERAQQQQARFESELSDLVIQIEEAASQQHQAEINLVAAEAEKMELDTRIQEIETVYHLSEQRLATQRSVVQDLSEQLHEATYNERHCRERIADFDQRTAMIAQHQAVLTENLRKQQLARETLDESSLLVAIEDWQLQRDQHEAELTQVREELTVLSQSLRDKEQARLQAEQRLHVCNETISAARLRGQESAMIEAQFTDKLAELETVEFGAVRSLLQEQPEKLQLRIHELGEAIAAMGAVNLAALEELAALNVRYDQFASQLADLDEAIAVLEQAIRQIDHETRERLLATFDQVNTNLAELFASVFGGGSAKLLLSGEDILDAGVQLNAQPPGKRNSSIQLLSGGEKALTALALVFSLFRLNPAPFCLLDEVDAPLDDSNTMRFCELVKRMSTETRFLFISHNKITMRMAQQLIGVTMREQGVSRLVSVDMEKIMTADNEIEHVLSEST